MTRLLGIDLGEKRIGLAIGDTGMGVALPIATISRGHTVEADARTIARIAAERRADALVVGLPIDMSGEEGAQAERTRTWANAVASATRLPLTFRDERLSSERAGSRVPALPRGRSGGPPSAAQRDAYRGRIDREAAAIILQDELDSIRNAAASDSRRASGRGAEPASSPEPGSSAPDGASPGGPAPASGGSDASGNESAHGTDSAAGGELERGAE